MHLHHDSLASLPLASSFMTFWLRHAQKSNFEIVFGRESDLRLKAFRFLEFFFSPFLFLLFFPFCCSDWPSNAVMGLLAVKKTYKKASSRRAIFTMEQPDVVAGNFGLSFLLHFLSIFVHISGSIQPITLIWASLERSSLPAEVEHRWCQFGQKWWRQKWKKGQGSSRPVRAGMGVNRLTQCRKEVIECKKR